MTIFFQKHFLCYTCKASTRIRKSLDKDKKCFDYFLQYLLIFDSEVIPDMTLYQESFLLD